MVQFRNDTPGARAVLLRGRSYAMIESGETASFADADVISWPADLTHIDYASDPSVEKQTLLEQMDDDSLRLHVEKLTGSKPHHKTGRTKLIETALSHLNG